MATPELPKQLDTLHDQIKENLQTGERIGEDLLRQTKETLTNAKEALKSATADQRVALLERVNSMQDTLKSQVEKHPEIKELLDSMQEGFHKRFMEVINGAKELPKTLWQKVGDWVANIADWVQKNPQIMNVLAMFGIGQVKPKENEQPKANPQTAPNAAAATVNQPAGQNAAPANAQPAAPAAPATK